MEWNNPTVKEHMVLPFGLTKALQAILRLTATIEMECLRTFLNLNTRQIITFISFASRN